MIALLSPTRVLSQGGLFVSVNPSPLGPILDRRSIYIGATAVWASA